MSEMQVVFDRAVAAMIAQGSKSVTRSASEPACMYRSNYGKKCAIGHLITDEQMFEYNIQESLGVHTFPNGLLDSLLPTTSRGRQEHFLSALQRAHDCADENNFVESFLKGATDVAVSFGLEEYKA